MTQRGDSSTVSQVGVRIHILERQAESSSSCYVKQVIDIDHLQGRLNREVLALDRQDKAIMDAFIKWTKIFDQIQRNRCRCADPPKPAGTT